MKNKRFCGDANGCSLHDEGDIGLIGNECSSESEDDLNDESLQVELAGWAM